MRRVVLAVSLLVLAAVASAEKADLVVVKKSESRLYLKREGKQFASFRVAFGGEPKGHKQEEGDERTPEGRSVFHISYPNAQDRAAAKARGVSPGGLIMVHGQRNGLGWLAPIAQLLIGRTGALR